MSVLSRRIERNRDAIAALRPALFSRESGLFAVCAIVAAFLWRLMRQNAVVRRLRRQNQRVSQLEEVKSTYLRLASHELRTPIGVARGYVDLALAGELGPLPDPLRQALTRMAASLHDVDAILGEMVEIARMQEGRRLLHVETLDVREAVTEAAQRVLPLSPRHNLVVTQPESPLLIVGDRSRMRAAVRNLLDNAVKYSPEGGEVRCIVSEERGMASITVSDQGVGITQSQLRRIFQRFERAPQAGAVTIPGTGLGLHLAREIARAHNGELRVTSQPGLGTTFVLVVPMVGQLC